MAKPTSTNTRKLIRTCVLCNKPTLLEFNGMAVCMDCYTSNMKKIGDK